MNQFLLTGYVCCSIDGWSTNLVKTNGTVHIHAWLLDNNFHDFTVATQEVNIFSGESPILFPEMDFSDFYINVEVKENNIYIPFVFFYNETWVVIVLSSPVLLLENLSET